MLIVLIRGIEKGVGNIQCTAFDPVRVIMMECSLELFLHWPLNSVRPLFLGNIESGPLLCIVGYLNDSLATRVVANNPTD